MMRPKLGARVINGLRTVYRLAESALDDNPRDLVDSQEEDARAALAYIQHLCIWYGARVPRRDTHGNREKHSDTSRVP